MKAEAVAAYLTRIDELIAAGNYKDDWASLSQYPVAGWDGNAKFGLFNPLGVFRVPPLWNSWYPRPTEERTCVG